MEKAEGAGPVGVQSLVVEKVSMMSGNIATAMKSEFGVENAARIELLASL